MDPPPRSLPPMRMTASWFESANPGFTEYKVVRRRSPPDRRLPSDRGASPRAAAPRNEQLSRGPDPPQRDTVLAAVKAWPAEPGGCAFDRATAILDGGRAR